MRIYVFDVCVNVRMHVRVHVATACTAPAVPARHAPFARCRQHGRGAEKETRGRGLSLVRTGTRARARAPHHHRGDGLEALVPADGRAPVHCVGRKHGEAAGDVPFVGHVHIVGRSREHPVGIQRRGVAAHPAARGGRGGRAARARARAREWEMRPEARSGPARQDRHSGDRGRRRERASPRQSGGAARRGAERCGHCARGGHGSSPFLCSDQPTSPSSLSRPWGVRAKPTNQNFNRGKGESST